MSNSVLNELFTDSDMSSQEWEQQNKSGGSDGKGFGKGLPFISSYYLPDKPGSNIGLISYLSDGIRISAHYVVDPAIGSGNRRVKVHILCKRKQCELCNSGDTPGIYQVWPVIDWLHQFTRKDGSVVKQPMFKLFIKGKNAFVKAEERRKKFGIPTGEQDDNGQPVRTMVGLKWEVTRTGTSFHTNYDPLPADPTAMAGEARPEKIDFSQTRSVTVKDKDTGQEKEVQVPLIAVPDGWPSYDTQREPHLQSIYSRNKLCPGYEIDWNNPKHVDEWLMMYFVDTPQETYVRLGVPYGGSNHSVDPSNNDDGIPF